MYSVSTYHLAKILEMSFLLSLSQLFMVAAVLSWGVTFAGLVDSRLNRRSGTQEPHTTSAGPPQPYFGDSGQLHCDLKLPMDSVAR
jgi:hypothetical protein